MPSYQHPVWDSKLDDAAYKKHQTPLKVCNIKADIRCNNKVWAKNEEFCLNHLKFINYGLADPTRIKELLPGFAPSENIRYVFIFGPSVLS